MAVEDPATKHRVELARNLPDSIKEVCRDPLGPKLSDEAFVVDLALDFPRRDDEVSGHLREEETAPR
jgi:hypothetical protein